ncbi:MAG: nucleotidyltransferase [Coriobacteriia bacterium]|nr:nucleotidyltransferase [Coriobacteriia bacterium]
MGNKEAQLSLIFNAIADEINISDTMTTKAIESYKAVGTFLGNNIFDSNVRIIPQGSFNLGTVIRPLSDEDSDYDIDLVCLLGDATAWDEGRIKNTIGTPLENSDRYGPSMESEGKRCWTLNYSGFHIDILPCSPRYDRYTNDKTSIRLTHRRAPGIYESRYSNPHLYGLWFEKRMTISLMEARQKYAARNAVEIETVQTYNVRTPLQKAVQLLKRHRDIMFAEDGSDAPISIIITTLAGMGYNGNGNLYETLKEILSTMDSAVRIDSSGLYHIENPVEKSENFADKWNEERSKAEGFYRWLRKAQKDIINNPESTFGLDLIAEGMKPAFGETVVIRAYNAVGDKMHTLSESGKLGVLGSAGGLLEASRAAIAKPVKKHTFYGE